ncbi:MAG: class I tRNA ligase family protein, partial [Pseudomonadota bacterium]
MKAGLPNKEPKWLERWQAEGVYDALRAQRQGKEKFVLHDGPPYANGAIHLGHALNKILKDVIVRSQSMLGKDVPYVPGWDCHGLPIEWKIEEKYRKKKKNKDEVDPVEFRKECREFAGQWIDTQRQQFKRLGIFGDWDNPYLTMDYAAEAAIAAELLKFAESGQLYRGAKPVMWSPVEKTALAEAEVEYEDIVSTQIDVGFEITEAPHSRKLQDLITAGKKVLAVIWTTTPWTIPVNQALAYSERDEYLLIWSNRGLAGASADNRMINDTEFYYLVAADLASEFQKRTEFDLPAFSPEDVEATLKGSDLKGAFAKHPLHDRSKAKGWDNKFFERPRPFLPGDFVTTDAGTGLVHMAPDHGEDDFDLCKKHGIDPVFAVNPDGKYREDWP